MADAEKGNAEAPPQGLVQQITTFWNAYNGVFAWCAAITISCALGGVMGGIRNAPSVVRARPTAAVPLLLELPAAPA